MGKVIISNCHFVKCYRILSDYQAKLYGCFVDNIGEAVSEKKIKTALKAGESMT